MKCTHCDSEMDQGGHCREGIDESAIKGERNCHDCGVAPGATHHPGCDTERCACGGQALGCGNCSDEEYLAARGQRRWTGVWPGVLECRHHNLYCRDLIDGQPSLDINVLLEAREQGARVEFHVPCGADEYGAHEDLNQWHRLGCPGIPE